MALSSASVRRVRLLPPVRVRSPRTEAVEGVEGPVGASAGGSLVAAGVEEGSVGAGVSRERSSCSWLSCAFF